MRAPAWLCVALAACLCAGCGGSGEAPTVAAGGSAAGGSAGVSPLRALEGDFAVFRRAQGEEDAIPESLLPRDTARSIGLRPRTSRRARRYAGAPVYVVLSAELACTYSAYHPVGNCWPIPTVRRGLAFAASICGLGTRKGEIVVYGIVPDGVRRVRLLREDGRDPTVPVHGNLFVAPSSSEPPLPRQLVLLEGDRRLVRPSGIPSDVARRGCGAGRPHPARGRPPGLRGGLDR